MIKRGHLWTAQEAAVELGVSVSAIKVWRHRGHLEPAVAGRPALFWSDDLYDCQSDRQHADQRTVAQRITAV